MRFVSIQEFEFEREQPSCCKLKTSHSAFDNLLSYRDKQNNTPCDTVYMSCTCSQSYRVQPRSHNWGKPCEMARFVFCHLQAGLEVDRVSSLDQDVDSQVFHIVRPT